MTQKLLPSDDWRCPGKRKLWRVLSGFCILCWVSLAVPSVRSKLMPVKLNCFNGTRLHLERLMMNPKYPVRLRSHDVQTAQDAANVAKVF